MKKQVLQTFGEYNKKHISKSRLKELKELHNRFPCSTGQCNICEIVKRQEK